MPDQLDSSRLAILIRVEDPGFYEHRGVDLFTPGSGFTTITQALVKRLYFESFEPGLAKITQSLYAFGFDRRIDKRTQLTLFLNTVYLGSVQGREVRGLSAAARAYFGKELHELSHEDYLGLVAMIIGPNRYHVLAAPGTNRERSRRIHRLVRGECSPQGRGDVYYEACR